MIIPFSRFLIPAIVIIALSACSSDGNGDVDPTDSEELAENDTPESPIEPPGDLNPGVEPGPEPVSDNAQSARYRLTFTATWSAETHPDGFPPNPHFSGLIGAVHNEQVIFWERGQIASDGLEVVAEVGSKSTFRNELNTAIAEGTTLSLIDAGGVSLSPGSVAAEFSVTRDYPQITVISMLAPSPDWFVGVHNLSLLDSAGQFVEEEVIDLRLYDSGTDSGETYTASNSDTSPREPVSLFSAVNDSLPFIDGLPSVGQFTIEKIE